jgi:hypothetical protein
MEGESDYFPLREVPREWLGKRVMAAAVADGEYKDIKGNPRATLTFGLPTTHPEHPCSVLPMTLAALLALVLDFWDCAAIRD